MYQVGEGVNVSLIFARPTFLKVSLLAAIITKKQHIFNITFVSPGTFQQYIMALLQTGQIALITFLQDVGCSR